ncbi:MAG: DUF2231 domain-containing protein [Anaerolineae bacterium]|nr:hypothetical protein [Anaerolineae bacterium]MDW8099340.1 DUF2231 domain-containing protein [Anaerolineae bacterium]
MPLHPRVIHFPIALLLTGTALAFFAFWRRDQLWDKSAHRLLVIGWLSLLPAALTGLISLNELATTDPRRAAVNTHITYFFATLITFGAALYVRLREPAILDHSRRRWYYLGALALGSLFVFLTGHTGGQLVYQLGIGVAR